MIVTIDDYLPFYNGGLLFLHYTSYNGDNNYWAPLMEKAAAKVFANYENLNYGWQSESLRILTGAPTYMYYNSNYDADAIF